jgi:hypothetical protein
MKVRKLTSTGAAMVAALGVTAALVGPAAAAAPAGGPVAVYAAAGGNSSSQKIVFVGAIGDYGTATSIDKNGKVNPNGNFVKAKLKKGTFEIDATAVNKTLNNASPQVANPATCSATFSGTGEVKFFNGTGLYKGISGTANVTITFGGVAPRYKSGQRKGQCMRNYGNPHAQFGFVTGQGTVSFPA